MTRPAVSAASIRSLCRIVSLPGEVGPLTEVILPKERILELSLNVIEWGPGVYGAELRRDSTTRRRPPRWRKPGRMDNYHATIETRMRQMGWQGHQSWGNGGRMSAP